MTVTNGQFSVQLGADTGANPLSPAIFEDPIFLGIQVDLDAEMTPRQALTAVGYAFRSKTVENDTLNSLSCAANEIPKFIGGIWVCAIDRDSNFSAGNGLILNGTSFSVNTNVIQNRVDGTCAVGSSIRAIAANGTVTCEVDNDGGGDITAVNAGSGLTGGAVSGNATLSIPTGGVNANHLATNSVGSAEIATGAVGTSEVLNNSLTGSDIALSNSLTAGHLAPNSVNSSEIATNAVGAAEIATNAVGSIEVANNSLTANDLATNSVGASEIANGAVGISELSNSAKGIGVSGSIIIPSATFQPANDTIQYVSDSHFIRPGGSNVNLCLQAPVILPHGVTVTSFAIFAMDNSGTTDVGAFTLERFNYSTSIPTTIGTTVASSGLPNSTTIRILQAPSINPFGATIDGSNSSYAIEGCLSSGPVTATNIRLYGARIRYN